MFWNLILAHLTADYLLQTDWMVRNRDKPAVMLLHACTHFAMMFLLSGSARTVLWTYLLMISALHIGQDLVKISSSGKNPKSNSIMYLLDQSAHYAILLLASFLFQQISLTAQIAARENWVMIAIAFLFTTQVWFISERIFFANDPKYFPSLQQNKFKRMAARGSILGLFLLARDWANSGLAFSTLFPYSKSAFWKRELLIDAVVSCAAIGFLIWALV